MTTATAVTEMHNALRNANRADDDDLMITLILSHVTMYGERYGRDLLELDADELCVAIKLNKISIIEKLSQFAEIETQPRLLDVVLDHLLADYDYDNIDRLFSGVGIPLLFINSPILQKIVKLAEANSSALMLIIDHFDPETIDMDFTEVAICHAFNYGVDNRNTVESTFVRFVAYAKGRVDLERVRKIVSMRADRCRMLEVLLANM